MSFKRQRFTRGAHPEVPTEHVEFLLDGDCSGSAEKFVFSCNPKLVRQAWQALHEEILADWTREQPGHRPWAWWEFSAPRWERRFAAFWDGTLPEPRLRIGGKGTPAYEALNVVPYFDRGIPRSWVSDFDVSYYNGRAVDVHGNRIGTNFKEGQFPFDAIDPADPPRFESEASYLKRLGLLPPGEEARLTVDDFADEMIGPEDNDE